MPYIGLFRDDKATIVGHDNHLVTVNGYFDRVLEAVIHEVHHDVFMTTCLKDLGELMLGSAMRLHLNPPRSRHWLLNNPRQVGQLAVCILCRQELCH